MKNLSNFHYAMNLLNILYGITIQEDEFEEIALTGWNLIGNKRTRIYRYKAVVSDCEKGIKLPCNCDYIEAVTTNFEDWNYSTNDTPNGNIRSAYIESYIEHRKEYKDPLYASGKFIKYERVNDTLYFDKPYGEINILYKGELLDDEGLPEITDKEAVALATYCAYILKYKEGLQTSNPTIIQLSETLRQKWLIQCDQARVDYYMSQNEWDQVLDAKNSWNRKQHNRSYKIYK